MLFIESSNFFQYPYFKKITLPYPAQLDGAVEYTDCIFAERVRPPPQTLPNKCPGYDIKQSDSEALVMLELWGMQKTPSMPSFLGPLWLAVLAPDRVLSMGQIELFDIYTEGKQMTYAKLNCLKLNCFII